MEGEHKGTEFMLAHGDPYLLGTIDGADKWRYEVNIGPAREAAA